MIVNKKSKHIVWSMPRIGSTFVDERLPKKLADWFKVKDEFTFNFKKYTIFKVTRDPYDRWISWMSDFVLEVNENDYNLSKFPTDNFDKWVEDFSALMHYDTHTQLQSVIYNKINSKRVKYLHIDDLNRFFGLEESKKTRSHSVVRSYLSPLEDRIKNLYKKDYEWLDTIKNNYWK